jgi:uncharacterized membrane protein YfhO
MKTEYVKQIIKSNSKETNNELVRLSSIVVKTINSNLKENKLSVSGNESVLENIVLYGYDEVMKCLSITLKNYSHLDDEEMMSKYNGIIYNRNEKKQLIKI